MGRLWGDNTNAAAIDRKLFEQRPLLTTHAGHLEWLTAHWTAMIPESNNGTFGIVWRFSGICEGPVFIGLLIFCISHHVCKVRWFHCV